MNRGILAGLLVLAATVAAHAERPTEYTIKLTPAQMDIVGRALGERPYNEVVLTIGELSRQVSEQNAAANKPIPAPPPAPEKPAPPPGG